MEKPKLDVTKLTPEQRDKIEFWQSGMKQLQTLEDIAALTKNMLAVMTNQEPSGGQKDKEVMPDFASPVVEAIAKLEKALGDISASKAPAPIVKVAAPNVTVKPSDIDIKGLEKAINAIPKAFEQAIKLIPEVEIPETDNRELLEAWEGISEQLQSIDTASRMKTQFPSTLKVTNNDGTAVNIAPNYAIQVRIDSVDTNVSYVGKANPGSATSGGVWQVAKVDETGGETVMTWADGNDSFDNIYDNRESLSYS